MAVVMGDVRRPSPLHGAAGGGGLAPVRRGRSNHAAAQSRLAAHGARRCEQQAGCVGALGRARRRMCGGPEPLQVGPQVSDSESQARGGRAGGSHRITNATRRAKER